MKKLRYYETFFLLRPDLSDEERKEIIEKFKSIITDHGGQIVKVDPWPLRTLAYKVQKLTKGYYVLLEYGAPGETISELTRNLRLDENVLKFVTIKKDDDFEPSKVSSESTSTTDAQEDAKTSE